MLTLVMGGIIALAFYLTGNPWILLSLIGLAIVGFFEKLLNLEKY